MWTERGLRRVGGAGVDWDGVVPITHEPPLGRSQLTFSRTTLGACFESPPLGAGLHFAISPRMWRRPSPA